METSHQQAHSVPAIMIDCSSVAIAATTMPIQLKANSHHQIYQFHSGISNFTIHYRIENISNIWPAVDFQCLRPRWVSRGPVCRCKSAEAGGRRGLVGRLQTTFEGASVWPCSDSTVFNEWVVRTSNEVIKAVSSHSFLLQQSPADVCSAACS